MTKKMKEGLIDGVKLDCLFDWLCNNNYKISKEELTTIAKELAFALYMAKRYLPKSKQEKIENEIINELNDRIYVDEEGE